MIALTKTDEPEILVQNAATWTADLQTEIQNGGDKVAYRTSKYRHPQIKEALKQETHRKCAYCESKPLHVTFGDIEHVIPKSEDVNLTFEWSNLTLACDVCNTNKGTKVGLIDPYGCDPEQEFEFFGPQIFHRSGHAVAEYTHIELDLNRMDLLERRRDRLRALRDKFEKFDMNPDPALAQLLKNAALAYETSQDREFAACARAFLA
jgi:hypothetical protein